MLTICHGIDIHLLEHQLVIDLILTILKFLVKLSLLNGFLDLPDEPEHLPQQVDTISGIMTSIHEVFNSFG